jgi:hypothetical protein
MNATITVLKFMIVDVRSCRGWNVMNQSKVMIIPVINVRASGI